MLRVDVTAWLHTEVLQAAEETGEVREGSVLAAPGAAASQPPRQPPRRRLP